jgi:hypothetical protein
MKRAIAVVIAMVCSGGVAAAQVAPTQETPAVAAVAEPGPQFSLTWSPVHLVLPVVELEGEYNAAPHMGVGLILGAGRVSDEMNTITATAYEVGGQFNYYIMDRFDGLHAGAELLYITAGDVAQDSSITATGLSAAGYVGYKLMTSFGFTFVAQGGVAYYVVQAESSSAMAEEKNVYPLINLNLGWSF